MTLTETAHGTLDLTEVALDLTQIIDSVPRIDESLPNPDYAEARDAYDRALYEAAKTAHPEHEWHIEEPPHTTVLIDAGGVIWTFTDPDPGNECSWPEWTPHCWSVIHKLVTTGPIGNDWVDVLDAGPIRTYVPEIDGPAVRRWRYRPGGASADADPTEYLCDSFPLSGDVS